MKNFTSFIMSVITSVIMSVITSVISSVITYVITLSLRLSLRLSLHRISQQNVAKQINGIKFRTITFLNKHLEGLDFVEKVE